MNETIPNPNPADTVPPVVIPAPPVGGSWVEWLKWGVPVVVALITMVMSLRGVESKIEENTEATKQQVEATNAHAAAILKQAEQTEKLAWQVWLSVPVATEK